MRKNRAKGEEESLGAGADVSILLSARVLQLQQLATAPNNLFGAPSPRR